MTWSPERPIEIIAGTPAGGGEDRAALVEHRWDDTHLHAAAAGGFLDEERVRLAAALKGLGDG